jgi:hypothetical protein
MRVLLPTMLLAIAPAICLAGQTSSTQPPKAPTPPPGKYLKAICTLQPGVKQPCADVLSAEDTAKPALKPQAITMKSPSFDDPEG